VGGRGGRVGGSWPTGEGKGCVPALMLMVYQSYTLIVSVRRKPLPARGRGPLTRLPWPPYQGEMVAATRTMAVVNARWVPIRSKYRPSLAEPFARMIAIALRRSAEDH
jgi:hypothetical protein